jgi:hypothetical protein
MRLHFVRKKVPKMRTTKVSAQLLNTVRRPETIETKPEVNGRLQALGRMVIQQHLEAFKRLADK